MWKVNANGVFPFQYDGEYNFLSLAIRISQRIKEYLFVIGRNV